MIEIVEVKVIVDIDKSRIGYAKAVLKDGDFRLQLDGIIIYRDNDIPALAYPMWDRKRDIAYFNPLNKQTAKMIETAVFSELLKIQNMTFT